MTITPQSGWTVDVFLIQARETGKRTADFEGYKGSFLGTWNTSALTGENMLLTCAGKVRETPTKGNTLGYTAVGTDDDKSDKSDKGGAKRRGAESAVKAAWRAPSKGDEGNVTFTIAVIRLDGNANNGKISYMESKPLHAGGSHMSAHILLMLVALVAFKFSL